MTAHQTTTLHRVMVLQLLAATLLFINVFTPANGWLPSLACVVMFLCQWLIFRVLPNRRAAPTPLSKLAELEDLLELHYGLATLPYRLKRRLETMRWFLERMEGTRSRQEATP